ncbi:MAG TPA: hypothetical protein DIS78_07115 [Lachnospiraceae bacterium]|nr:hypothetical protein [Lachnospiraceae bacterium]
MNRVKYAIITILAVIHQAVTGIADLKIFTVPVSANPVDYVTCKISALIVSWAFFHMLWQLFMEKDGLIKGRKDERNTVSRVVIKALPYLFIMIPVCIFKLRGGYLSNDETLIYENAVTLTHYTWFYYITTYYYIISLMLIPHMYAPIFVKLIIEFLTIGYVVLRSSDYFAARQNEPFIRKPVKIGYGALIMLLFVLYPVIAYTTSAHRLPIYFLLYLLLITMLLFDRLEQAALTIPRLLTIIILGCILTQWRTEGIYLLVLIPILVLLCYENIHLTGKRTLRLKDKKVFVISLIIYLICQYVISIPQNGLMAKEIGAAADDRMKPFYAYTITNMYRNGLDLDRNSEDLAIVDKYISLESLDKISSYYGDINYEDVLILYQPGFVGVREEAGVTEYYDFVLALKRIFKNNPKIFLRTRIGAFVYAALPFHITFTGLTPGALVSFAVSVVKTVSYNLFIPLVTVLFLCLYSLARGRWFTFFTTGGLLAHWFIVFILAPASYFKYYFPVYIIAYLYLLLIIIAGLYNRRHSTKIKILQ